MSTQTIVAKALDNSNLSQKEITDLFTTKVGGIDKAIKLLERQIGSVEAGKVPETEPQKKLTSLFQKYLETQDIDVTPVKDGSLKIDKSESGKVKKALEELTKASEVTNFGKIQGGLTTGLSAFTQAYKNSAGSRA